jgi:hypothetical protein
MQFAKVRRLSFNEFGDNPYLPITTKGWKEIPSGFTRPRKEFAFVFQDVIMEKIHSGALWTRKLAPGVSTLLIFPGLQGEK